MFEYAHKVTEAPQVRGSYPIPWRLCTPSGQTQILCHPTGLGHFFAPPVSDPCRTFNQSNVKFGPISSNRDVMSQFGGILQ